MKHVKRGCLTRPTNDIRTDGSRIENTNRAWNGISRASACGLVAFTDQAEDFVIRRNIRLALLPAAKGSSIEDFARSTHGSHHIGLVLRIANIWNPLVAKKKYDLILPVLTVADSHETFGILAALTNEGSNESENLYELTQPPEDDKLACMDLVDDVCIEPRFSEVLETPVTSLPPSRSSSLFNQSTTTRELSVNVLTRELANLILHR